MRWRLRLGLRWGVIVIEVQVVVRIPYLGFLVVVTVFDKGCVEFDQLKVVGTGHIEVWMRERWFSGVARWRYCACWRGSVG